MFLLEEEVSKGPCMDSDAGRQPASEYACGLPTDGLNLGLDIAQRGLGHGCGYDGGQHQPSFNHVGLGSRNPLNKAQLS